MQSCLRLSLKASQEDAFHIQSGANRHLLLKIPTLEEPLERFIEVHSVLIGNSDGYRKADVVSGCDRSTIFQETRTTVSIQSYIGVERPLMLGAFVLVK